MWRWRITFYVNNSEAQATSTRVESYANRAVHPFGQEPCILNKLVNIVDSFKTWASLIMKQIFIVQSTTAHTFLHVHVSRQ